MIFEFVGVYLVGGEVILMICKGIIDIVYFVDIFEYLVLGMILFLFVVGLWLVVVLYLGWLVFIIYFIVGVIIGFMVVGVSMDVVEWSKVGGIVGSWIVMLVIFGVIVYLIFMSVYKLIFEIDKLFYYVCKYVLFYMVFVGFVMLLVIIKKGLKYVGLDLFLIMGYVLFVVLVVIIVFIGKWFISCQVYSYLEDVDLQCVNVEKVFVLLMVVIVCCMVFVYGFNDVVNVIGLLVVVVSVVFNGGEIGLSSVLVFWILFLGGLGIVVGLVLFGYCVIVIIGEGIIYLIFSCGFVVEMVVVCIVVIVLGIGLLIFIM